MTNRADQLIRLLEAGGSQPIPRLAAALGVSDETVRREVAALAGQGRVARRHGAVGLPGAFGEAPWARRMGENAAAKQAIGRRFAAMVPDGASLMLDTGTTTAWAARALSAHRGLTVITNSTDIARTLAAAPGARVFLAGGELRADSAAAFGAEALAYLARFRVGFAVISAGALGPAGVQDAEPDEAEVARAMLAAGERRVVLADAAKAGRRALAQVAGWGEVSDLVTDATPSGPLAGALTAAGVSVTLAEGGA